MCTMLGTVVPVLCTLDVYLCLMRFLESHSCVTEVEQIMNLIFCPVIMWYSTGTISSLPCSPNLCLFLGLYLGTMLSSCHPPIVYSKLGVLSLYLNSSCGVFFHCSDPGKLCGQVKYKFIGFSTELKTRRCVRK